VTALLRGERIYLREVQLSDVTEQYHRWMNDPDVIRFLESRFHPPSVDNLRETVASYAADPKNLFLAIVTTDTERHVGNIKIGPIDAHHGVADVGLIVGEKDCWGKGFATEAIQLVMRHAFGALGLRRLTAGAYATNIGSIRAFEKAGFSREGVRRKHYLCDGSYVDGILLGVLREDVHE
jgi:ribosomal-protein-alanine N-acetyltransferase